MASTPSAIAVTRVRSSARRSIEGRAAPALRHPPRPRHWRRGSAGAAQRTASAMARSARSLSAGARTPGARAAARASAPSVPHARRQDRPILPIVLSGALMAVDI